MLRGIHQDTVIRSRAPRGFILDVGRDRDIDHALSATVGTVRRIDLLGVEEPPTRQTGLVEPARIITHDTRLARGLGRSVTRLDDRRRLHPHRGSVMVVCHDDHC